MAVSCASPLSKYTTAQTCYLVGFAIMQLPSTLIALKVRPSIYLFACELGWGIFTVRSLPCLLSSA